MCGAISLFKVLPTADSPLFSDNRQIDFAISPVREGIPRPIFFASAENFCRVNLLVLGRAFIPEAAPGELGTPRAEFPAQVSSLDFK